MAICPKAVDCNLARLRIGGAEVGLTPTEKDELSPLPDAPQEVASSGSDDESRPLSACTGQKYS